MTVSDTAAERMKALADAGADVWRQDPWWFANLRAADVSSPTAAADAVAGSAALGFASSYQDDALGVSLRLFVAGTQVASVDLLGADSPLAELFGMMSEPPC